MVEIGWQVIDRDGNIIDSGPIVEAQMVAELAEAFGLDLEGK